MSTNTTNYNLVKPNSTEYYDVSIGNSNLDIVDLELKENENKLTAHSSNYTKHKLTVKDYGAVGDGFTDDTTAIQNAINYIVAQGGGTLFFPNGNYKVSKIGTRVLSYSDISRSYSLLINNTSNITIKFDANAFIYVPIDDTLVTNAFWIESCSNVKLYNTKFVGVGTTTTILLEEGVGISFTECNNCSVDGSYSENMRGNARAYESNRIAIKDSFSKIYSQEHSSGHFCLFSCKDSIIENCTSYGCTDDGDIFIYGGLSKNCTIKGCSSYSYIYGDTAKTIPDLEAQGMCIDGGSRDCQIIDSYVYGYFYGFDVKSGSEGCLIKGCTAERCKVGISGRKGEATTSINTLQILGNTIIPNGGNGNNNTYLSLTDPVGISVIDCNGGTIIDNNIIYNSLDSVANLDFVGIVYAISDDTSDADQGNTLITNNNFVMENRLGNKYGSSRKQAVFIVTGYKIFNLSIENNTFDLPQTGMLTNVIEVNKVFGLSISNNNFTNLPVTGLPLIKIDGSYRIKIQGNVIGFHWGILNISNSQGLSFNNNVSGESIAGTGIPALDILNTQNITISNNNQLLTTSINSDDCYFITTGTTNWIVAIGNMLNLYNKDNTNWYSLAAGTGNFLIEHNVIN